LKPAQGVETLARIFQYIFLMTPTPHDSPERDSLSAEIKAEVAKRLMDLIAAEMKKSSAMPIPPVEAGTERALVRKRLEMN
jgi:hypothetical protein